MHVAEEQLLIKLNTIISIVTRSPASIISLLETHKRGLNQAVNKEWLLLIHKTS